MFTLVNVQFLKFL